MRRTIAALLIAAVTVVGVGIAPATAVAQDETAPDDGNDDAASFGELVSAYVQELTNDSDGGGIGPAVAEFVLANGPGNASAAAGPPDHAGPGGASPPAHANASAPGDTGPPDHAGDGPSDDWNETDDANGTDDWNESTDWEEFDGCADAVDANESTDWEEFEGCAGVGDANDSDDGGEGDDDANDSDDGPVEAVPVTPDVELPGNASDDAAAGAGPPEHANAPEHAAAPASAAADA